MIAAPTSCPPRLRRATASTSRSRQCRSQAGTGLRCPVPEQAICRGFRTAHPAENTKRYGGALRPSRRADSRANRRFVDVQPSGSIERSPRNQPRQALMHPTFNRRGGRGRCTCNCRARRGTVAARAIHGGTGELQRVWDQVLSRKPILLLLLGSALAMMKELNAYVQPFHARGREMVLSGLTPAVVADATGLSGIFRVRRIFINRRSTTTFGGLSETTPLVAVCPGGGADHRPT